MPNAGGGRETLTLPFSDPELVYRLCALESASLRLRMEVTRFDGEDPLGVVIEEHGPAMLFAALKAPQMGFFNTVIGLRSEQALELDTIFATLRDHHIPLRAAALPGSMDSGLANALVDAGLRPVNWWSILYRLAERVEVPQFEGVTIEAAGPNDAMEFGSVCAAGFSIATDDEPGVIPTIARWVTDIPDFTCYLARCDGEPAAIGVLYCQDELGYLAAAATHPDFRGRGCQTALIAQRIRDAAERGCEVAVVHTGFATGSQRNQERAGFQLAATCQGWAEPRSDTAAGGDV